MYFIYHYNLVDTGLHYILILLVFIAIYMLLRHSQIDSPTASTVSLVLASFALYWREVTQHQTKYFDSEIFSGWIPWFSEHSWSMAKQIETFVPIVLLIITVYLSRLFKK